MVEADVSAASIMQKWAWSNISAHFARNYIILAPLSIVIFLRLYDVYDQFVFNRHSEPPPSLFHHIT